MDKKYKSIEHKLKRLTLKQTEKPNNNIHFHPRVTNKTNIEFTKEEMTLLNKGLKYNLNHKRTHWLENLAFEAENAITLLPTQEQDFMRHQIAQSLEILHKQKTKSHQKDKNEYKTINRIRDKLKTERAIITRADKGNSIIIIHAEEYNKKVNTFITDNNFQKITNDITKVSQRDVRNTINECQTIIPKESRWKNINLNPA
jgi:hypothetical protein